MDPLSPPVATPVTKETSPLFRPTVAAVANVAFDVLEVPVWSAPVGMSSESSANRDADA